jgi:hypothetical protein
MEDTQEAVTGQEQAAAPEAAPQPELTIVDLQNLRAIFDVAASRGAFRANEMEAIGAQYNKLNTFLNAVAPQQPQDPAQQAEPQA